jgi:hypothetical protein
MSTSDSREALDLTGDEQILHHHAAMVKKDLEAYNTIFRSRRDWQNLFTDRAARLVL